MKKLARNLKKGFTITELVIVIAVIAILAAVLIPTFSSVIASARESAAMQECHNALIDYSVDAEKEGINTTGIVFVNNEYAFVNLNGNLHLLGKLDDLAQINSSGKAEGKIPSAASSKITGFEDNEDFVEETESGKGKVIVKLTNEAGETSDKTISLAKNEEAKKDEAVHEAEVLYIYYVVINDTTEYVGYFTYEQPSTAKFITDNETVYSRAYGYVVISGEETQAKMELDAPKAE